MSKLKINLPSRNAKPAADERVAEEFWANVGVYTPEYELEDGTVEKKFISLNYGIPLSAVQDMKKGSSDEWNALGQAKDDLRDQLLEIAQGLEPGQTEDVTVVLQVRRVGEKAAIDPKANPFMVSLKK